MEYTQSFLLDSIDILKKLPMEEIESVADVLKTIKNEGGRIFFAGSGGGAGHSSHAAADFRKLAGIESYSVTDNVSELSARINDNSWDESYAGWLKSSNLNNRDCLFIFSVGGGDAESNISNNLVMAIKLALKVGAKVTGIVGRNGGFLRQNCTASILIPTASPHNITTQVEGFQALLWHLLVCHPKLDPGVPKWESTSEVSQEKFI